MIPNRGARKNYPFDFDGHLPAILSKRETWHPCEPAGATRRLWRLEAQYTYRYNIYIYIYIYIYITAAVNCLLVSAGRTRRVRIRNGARSKGTNHVKPEPAKGICLTKSMFTRSTFTNIYIYIYIYVTWDLATCSAICFTELYFYRIYFLPRSNSTRDVGDTWHDLLSRDLLLLKQYIYIYIFNRVGYSLSSRSISLL